MEIPTIHINPVLSPGSGRSAQIDMPKNLREASQEFESLFIAQMMEAMRSAVPQSKFMGESSGQRTFRQMLDQEVSRGVARSGGFGIGEMLYRELGGDGEAAVSEIREGKSDESRSQRDR
jgi:Rod binding domain-containing protein